MDKGPSLVRKAATTLVAAGAFLATQGTFADGYQYAQDQCRDVASFDVFRHKIVEVACPPGVVPAEGGFYVGSAPAPFAPPVSATSHDDANGGKVEAFPDAANDADVTPPQECIDAINAKKAEIKRLTINIRDKVTGWQFDCSRLGGVQPFKAPAECSGYENFYFNDSEMGSIHLDAFNAGMENCPEFDKAY